MSRPQFENPTYNLWVGIQPYSIGEYSYVSEFTHISQCTSIGKFCSIANLCTIGAQNHPLNCLTSFPFSEVLKEKGQQKLTDIGHDVWIGCNSVVIEGVKVGHGAAIGAGSVVTKDVPPYAIVVGNPAKVLRYRFPPDIIEGMLKIEWWHLPLDIIRELPIKDVVQCIKKVRALRGI